MNGKSLGIIVAVLLIVSQIPGCIEKETETAKNVAPSIIINANVTTGYAPLKVAFMANATDPDGYIVNYTWDFGDENISYEQNPVHTFTRCNTFNVTLTIKDNNGSTATNNIWITAIEIGPKIPLELKAWAAENYGDGNCILEDTGDKVSLACMLEESTPGTIKNIPSGYTASDICNEAFITWLYQNVGWRIPEAKMMYMSTSFSPTICDWIDTIGLASLTRDHALYVYYKSQGWNIIAERKYDELSPKPDSIPIDLATRDNALGIYYYSQGWIKLGNMKTGCDYERIENLTVYFIDVGQGDSFLIKLPEKRYVMIDAGKNAHSDDVISLLDSMSITTLEAFIATHPDADHIGGADEVIEEFDVLSIYHPGYERETDDYTSFINAAENEGCPIYTDDDLDSGDFLGFNSCVTFQVMHIDKNAPNPNDACIVLRVDYDYVSFLFTGDISSGVENEIIQDQNLDFDIDILKVAHHGSKYSTCNDFLDATTPYVGVISVGSQHGHPTDETLNRLKDHGVAIYRTNLNGTITITTDGEEWDISCEKEEQPPPIDHIVINEMEQNPHGKDSGNDWLELFNPTEDDIDVSGWELQTTHGDIETHYIPEGTIINSGECLVITFSKQFLDNEDESVKLFNENGNEIDRTLVASDTRNDGRSWQRIPNGYDSDSNSDWEFRYATKGYSNS